MAVHQRCHYLLSKTPDLAALIQEIVNRSGYTSGSSIALLIEGTARRVVDLSTGLPVYFQLRRFFDTPLYDCLGLSAYLWRCL